MSQQAPWTLWSEARPTDLTLSYRWRIPVCDILGLMLRPEWTNKLRRRNGDGEYWPDCARWDGWNNSVHPGLEWRVAQPEEKDIYWGGLDLLPCPFTGLPPKVEYHGQWIGAPAYHPEWFSIRSHIVDSLGWRDAAKMRDAWNTRVKS